MYYYDELTVSPTSDNLEEQLSDAMVNFLKPVEPITIQHATVQEQKQDVIDNPVMLKIMDVYHAAKKLLRLQIDSDEILVAEQQNVLNTLYDAFVASYGNLSDRRNVSLIKQYKPDILPFMRALEVVTDDKTCKSPIFTTQIVRQESSRSISNPQEAFLACLDRFGRLDMEWIANTTKHSIADLKTALNGLVYETPEREFVTADEYLSGNILEKLNEARSASILDKQFQANVAALESVMPEAVGPGEITARLGAEWIPEDVLTSFVRELIPSYRGKARYIDGIHEWILTPTDDQYCLFSIENSRMWGTNRKTALDLLEDGLNLRNPIVYDVEYDDDGNRKSIVNQEETLLAQAKLQDIHDKFLDWIWQDSERSDLLVRIYNEKYNVYREREFDGSHLTLPGLSRTLPGTTKELMPYKHQFDAIWQGLQSKTMMLAHQVGSGKTLTMTVIAHELLRLGFVERCIVTVPNNIVEQWGTYIQSLYPDINLMVANSDTFGPEKRGEFLSRFATTNNVLAVFSHTMFKAIPLQDDTFNKYVQDEIDKLEESLQNAHESAEQEGWGRRKKNSTLDRITIKKIEKMIKRLETRLKNKESDIKRDSKETITFEEIVGSGRVAIFNDESHAHKNLGFQTNMNNIAGVPNSDSQRAFDMYVKTNYLLNLGGRVIFATATPVSNSLAELFTLMRYLQLPLLQRLGLDNFDSWVRVFASVISSIEMKVTGKWEVVQRLSRFHNLPELVKLLRQVWNVKNKEQLAMGEPTLYGDKPIVVKIRDTVELDCLLSRFEQRAMDIKDKKVDRTVDNFLKITTDLRKAALDVRLVESSYPEIDDNKINVSAQYINTIYQLYSKQRYTQLVFCDLSTPKSRKRVDEDTVAEEVLTDEELFLRDGVYLDLKRKLMKYGIPSNEIAFIHDHNTPAKKEKLFRDVNAGNVRILIGSTAKMGVGMNVQRLLIAIHYLTPPWRPMDIEQGDGRGLRPGNEVVSDRELNEVYKFIYATKACAFMWQILEAKARFVSQIMQGHVTIRSAEDIGDMILNAAQVKAIASGDSNVIKKVALDAEMVKLDRMYAAWKNNQHSMLREQQTLPGMIENLVKELEHHKNARDTRIQNTSDDFKILLSKPQVNKVGLEFDTLLERKDACIRILTLNRLVQSNAFRTMNDTGNNYSVKIGEYRGFQVEISVTPNGNTFYGKIEMWAGDDRITYAANITDTETGTIQSMDIHLKNIDGTIEQVDNRIKSGQIRLSTIDQELKRPWEHKQKWNKVKHEVNVLNKQLSGHDTDEEFVDGFMFNSEPDVDDNNNKLENTKLDVVHDLYQHIFFTRLKDQEPLDTTNATENVTLDEPISNTTHPTDVKPVVPNTAVKRRKKQDVSEVQLCLQFLFGANRN